jgi:glutaconate CoA-transferase subunit A
MNQQGKIGEKVMTLSEAVRTLIHDGDSICFANFGSPAPFSAIHEIVRQQKRDLEFIMATSYFEVDAMAATGCLRKVVHSYHFHPTSGERPFDRGVKEYGIEVVDYTNYTMAAMMLAGAMNIPFLPATPSLMLSDLYKREGDKKFGVVDNPFKKDEKVVLVPAANPEVAILHVQRADKFGNAQLWGPTGTQKHGAMAAKRIIVTTEEVIDNDVVRLSPNTTIVPGFRVDAVCVEPWGSHPVDCLGYYDMDLPYCALLYFQGRTEETYKTWLDEWVFGIQDRKEYIDHYADRFGASKLEKLKAGSLPSATVNLAGNFLNEFELRDIDRAMVDNAPDLFEVEVDE